MDTHEAAMGAWVMRQGQIQGRQKASDADVGRQTRVQQRWGPGGCVRGKFGADGRTDVGRQTRIQERWGPGGYAMGEFGADGTSTKATEDGSSRRGVSLGQLMPCHSIMGVTGRIGHCGQSRRGAVQFAVTGVLAAVVATA